MRFGGLIVSRTTLLGGADDSGLNTIDLVEPVSPRYAALAMGRVLRAPLRADEISILTPEDTVIFKVLSTRDRDLEDAAAIVRKLGGELDVAAIAEEVERLAREIEDHGVQPRWDRCLRIG